MANRLEERGPVVVPSAAGCLACRIRRETMSSEPGGFAFTYGVELLCERPPTIRKPELLRALKTHCPGVAPMDGQEDSALLAFIHTDHLVPMEDGALPAQTFIAASEEPFEVSEALSAALEQSWSPEAKKL